MSFHRRRLPHWQPSGRSLFLTWHLHGSLPRNRFPPPGSLSAGRAFVWNIGISIRLVRVPCGCGGPELRKRLVNPIAKASRKLQSGRDERDHSGQTNRIENRLLAGAGRAARTQRAHCEAVLREAWRFRAVFLRVAETAAGRGARAIRTSRDKPPKGATDDVGLEIVFAPASVSGSGVLPIWFCYEECRNADIPMVEVPTREPCNGRWYFWCRSEESRRHGLRSGRTSGARGCWSQMRFRYRQYPAKKRYTANSAPRCKPLFSHGPEKWTS
jgi:hypothetical protein